MGWDAFGLPAEQYALQNRELAAVNDKHVPWTQWVFARLFEGGLAYQAEVPVNWCPALGTILANEEVADGVSERSGHPVERRPMHQWVLKITEYTDRLLEHLNDLNWAQSINDMQLNW